MSYFAYKLIHFLGLFLVFAALGGLTFHVVTGGRRDHPSRKLLAISHGIGLFLVLLGGFGLLARLGIGHGLAWPGWVWAKFGLWLVLGGLAALPYRMPGLARPLWFALPLLGVIGAYLALYKPF